MILTFFADVLQAIVRLLPRGLAWRERKALMAGHSRAGNGRWWRRTFYPVVGIVVPSFIPSVEAARSAREPRRAS